MRKIEKLDTKICYNEWEFKGKIIDKINELVDAVNDIQTHLDHLIDWANKQTQEPERNGLTCQVACRHGTHPNCFCWQCDAESKIMAQEIKLNSKKEPECEIKDYECVECGQAIGQHEAHTCKHKEKPAKKECGCKGTEICFKCRPDLYPDHKDELADNLYIASRCNKASANELAGIARKWAVEVVDNSFNETTRNEHQAQLHWSIREKLKGGDYGL